MEQLKPYEENYSSKENNKKTHKIIEGYLYKVIIASILFSLILYIAVKLIITIIEYNQRVKDNEKLNQDIVTCEKNLVNIQGLYQNELNNINSKKSENSNCQNQIANKDNDLLSLKLEIDSLDKKLNELNNKNKELKINYEQAKKENERLKNVSFLELTNNNIIQSEKEKEQIEKWSNINLNNICYKTNNVDFSLDNFLDKCSQYNYTVILIKTKEGIRLGGFTKKSWSEYGTKQDKDSFIFSLTTMKKYNVNNIEYSITTGKHYISFGDDIIISNNYIISKFPFIYGNRTTDHYFDLFGNYKSLNLLSIEVYSN